MANTPRISINEIQAQATLKRERRMTVVNLERPDTKKTEESLEIDPKLKEKFRERRNSTVISTLQNKSPAVVSKSIAPPHYVPRGEAVVKKR